MSRELLHKIYSASCTTFHSLPTELLIEIEAELAKPEKKPLSDDEIVKLWGEPFSGTTQIVKDFARAIEKAHGI